MNKQLLACLLLTVGVQVSAEAQGTFQNLDFEAARLVFENHNTIAATNALPGWTAFSGTNQLRAIDYDEIASAPPVQLVSSNLSPIIRGISGRFAVLLSGGGDEPKSSISQTALVPGDAASLFFEMTLSGSSLPFSVYLGGQELPYSLISTSPQTHYTLYGADISAFAGQTETLTFSSGLAGGGILDGVQFSSEPIPEPGEFYLMTLGAVVLGLCRWRKSRRGQE